MPIKWKADCNILQHPLISLEFWSSNNSLAFNQSKCKVLPNTYAGSNEVLRVNKDSDIGVLKRDAYMYTIIVKPNRMLGLLKLTCRHLRDRSARQKLYFTIVRSHDQRYYASEGWSP